MPPIRGRGPERSEGAADGTRRGSQGAGREAAVQPVATRETLGLDLVELRSDPRERGIEAGRDRKARIVGEVRDELGHLVTRNVAARER